MDPNRLSDRELVARARDGDRDAFLLLYRRHLPHVYRFLYRQVGNRSDAEDLTSEVFLQALEGLDGYRGDGSFRSWLLGIARHKAADFWRRRAARPELSLDLFPPDRLAADPDGPEDDPAAQRAWLEALLAALPERYARVLRLRFLEGCSIRETARALGVSEGYAKVLQHRALRKAAEVAEALPVRAEEVCEP